MRKIFTKAGKEENNKGLTLIELLITIAVLAIVAAISLPILTSVIQRAQIDAHKAEMILTADTIKTSLSAMGGVAATNFNLGGGTLDSYIRINAGQDVRFRFDRQNESAFYTVTPSRVTRLVSDGAGTEADPYTGFCITAWVGNVNLELNSNDTEVTEYGEDSGASPCGLKPGPISVPSAPSLAAAGVDSPVAVLNNTIASVSFVAPEDVGGEEWTGLDIVDYRVTCTSSDGGATRAASGATSPIKVENLTENKNYNCTVAARNDGFLATDPNAWSDESSTTATFYMPNAPKAVITPDVGSPGPNVSVTWALAADPYGYDHTSEAYGGRMTINNYSVYYFERECKVNGVTVPPADPTAITAGATELKTNATDLTYTITSGLQAGKKYDVWVRAMNGAGPDPLGGTNYVGMGDVTYAGCAETGTDPDPMSVSTAASGNALIGTNNLSQKIQFSWVVGSASGAGTASAWFNGGLPIYSYEFQWDLVDTFDSTNGGPEGSNTKTHTGAQSDLQTVDVTGIPVSTTYYLRVRACNLLNGPTNPPVCAVDANGNPEWAVVSGASSATPAPPETVEAQVNEDGTANVTWN